MNTLLLGAILIMVILIAGGVSIWRMAKIYHAPIIEK